MKFRKDINGLRAIAIIAVVLFHFNENWLPGGFAGVDVFFVISGFLMTRIIFRGIEGNNFSILRFYIARVNRIIPALAILCAIMLVFGWFFIAPLEYKSLGKHVAGSIAFLSNIMYWSESGYFATASHGKWLLHTWSLSVEWQFYIIYPLILVILRKYISINSLKNLVLILMVLGFIFSIIFSNLFPDFAYFLLPTRAWEMMFGGVAYLYPLRLTEQRKKLMEYIGFILILYSYFFISSENIWPGYLALLPVMGVFLIIQSQRDNSFITNNFVFQKIGRWSYSIYLWHWPLVVAIYYFSLNEAFIYVGLILSVLFGFISYNYIETIKFRSDFKNLRSYLKCKPLYFVFIIGIAASYNFIENGFLQSASSEYKYLVGNMKPSPYRSQCHISEYQSPEVSCEYFKGNISWAVLGDSHSVEIAYELAKKLDFYNIGLKHFTFSGCKPSYKESNHFSKCSKWYNESIDYILKNKNIKNVVLNHRFTSSLFGGDASQYKKNTIKKHLITEQIIEATAHLDQLIIELSKHKENVYVYYPIPELPKDISDLVGAVYEKGKKLDNIVGTNLAWYEKRNKYFINHFNNATFPSNVHLLNIKNVFCNEKNCFAVKDSTPLYFDNDHPSLLASKKLVDLIKLQ